tara:strand:+ start:141 stop:1337 length:1197 start_codon:yes stop_codon:yes gene_type:complete
MTFFKLIYRQWMQQPFRVFVTLVLIALSAVLVFFTLSVQQQTEKYWSKQTSGIDVVVGAKGSPLQLVLANVFHADDPTGNIQLEDWEKVSQNGFVDISVPLAYGDFFKQYRIVGTDTDFQTFYNLEIAQGNWFEHSREVVLGSEVAQSLQMGDEFKGTHGEVNGHEHEEKYTVVGILKPTGGVADRLVLTSIESVWDVHHHEDEEHAEHEEHESEVEHHHEPEITAGLIRYKNAMAKLTQPKMINQNSELMAAVPTIEINKSLQVVGDVTEIFALLGWIIGAIACFTVFLFSWQSVQQRMPELATLRFMGAGAGYVFALVLIESVVLAVLGVSIGLLLTSVAMQSVQEWSTMLWGMTLASEAWLYGLLLIVLMALATAYPAWQVFRINLSETLKNGSN